MGENMCQCLLLFLRGIDSYTSKFGPEAYATANIEVSPFLTLLYFTTDTLTKKKYDTTNHGCRSTH